jgi:hypothetical protein
VKLQKCRHLHFIANQMNDQSATLTAAAAAKRIGTVMRKIDQVTACDGCGAAGPWLCG